jgi:hypothetical protein
VSDDDQEASMEQLTRVLAPGSVPLLVAAALFAAAAVVHLLVLISQEPEVVEEAAPVPPRSVPAQERRTDYLERMLHDAPTAEPVAFGVGELVAGAARTGRALGLNVSVLSRDETVEGVPDDLATVLDTLVTNISRQSGAREVLLRSERWGEYVELVVGPAGPCGDGGLGLQISRSMLRDQGGDLLLRDTEQGAAFVARVPAQRSA